MKRCVLHVGMHKTGSTSIQHSLHAGVAGSAYNYFSFGLVNGSIGMETIFVDNPEELKIFRERGWSSEKIMTYRRELTLQLDEALRTNEGNLIISGENMVNLSSDELSGLRDALYAHGYSIDVVIYVRPWHSWIESHSQEILKHGGRDASEYFPSPVTDDLRDHPLDFRGRIEKLDHVFGVDHVSVLNFASSTFPGGCVVRHFCSHLGIDPDLSRIVRVNEALKLFAIQLLYAYRIYGPAQRVGERAFVEKWLLVSSLYELGGNSMRFHSSLVDPMVDPFRSQQAWIEKRMGGPFINIIQDDAPGVIRCEADLFDFAPEALEWLVAKTGGKRLRLSSGEEAAREVAKRMHSLELSLGRRHRRRARMNLMKALPRIIASKSYREFKRLILRAE